MEVLHTHTLLGVFGKLMYCAAIIHFSRLHVSGSCSILAFSCPFFLIHEWSLILVLSFNVRDKTNQL